MRTSQYLSDYLSGNASRGPGKGITVGSYLNSVLRGKAKKYSGSYYKALVNSCERAGAIKGPSAQGSVAYYPAN